VMDAILQESDYFFFFNIKKYLDIAYFFREKKFKPYKNWLDIT
jgi:hypothetical protein